MKRKWKYRIALENAHEQKEYLNNGYYVRGFAGCIGPLAWPKPTTSKGWIYLQKKIEESDERDRKERRALIERRAAGFCRQLSGKL